MTITLSDNQIERWRSLYKEFQSDVQQIGFYKQLNQRRVVAQQEMLDFLDSYLKGQISTKQLKDTFDRNTRREWNCFGFKGMSGAMFLNKCQSQDFAGENRIILRVIPFPAALCSDLCHPRYLY